MGLTIYGSFLHFVAPASGPVNMTSTQALLPHPVIIWLPDKLTQTNSPLLWFGLFLAIYDVNISLQTLFVEFRDSSLKNTALSFIHQTSQITSVMTAVIFVATKWFILVCVFKLCYSHAAFFPKRIVPGQTLTVQLDLNEQKYLLNGEGLAGRLAVTDQ